MNFAPLSNRWKILQAVSDDCWVLGRKTGRTIRLAMLIRKTIAFVKPMHLTQAQQLMRQYPDPSTIATVGERLRYFRHRQAMLQYNVAIAVGMDIRSYSNYEDTSREYYPAERLDKLAEVLQVEVSQLLDGYNGFLYRGQGRELKAIRKGLKLTQYEFGCKMQVPTGTVKRWEQDKIRISKVMWQRLQLLNDKRAMD